MLSKAIFPDNDYLVAAAQMCSTPEVSRNLEQALELIESAAKEGARFIALPENLLYLRLENDERAPILFPDSASFEAIKEAAKKLKVWLLLGSLTEDSGDPKRPFNTTVVLDSSGEIKATYRKIHLFSLHSSKGVVVDEKLTIAPGKQVVMVKTPFGGLGLSICYDLRFPEVYRALMASGATLLAVPSAFTERTGRVHWHSLLKTRAVENQCYVVAPAQTGFHGGNRQSYGHSLILNPWGEIIAEAGEEPEVVLAEISPATLSDTRARVPVLEDIRLPLPGGVEIIEAR
tara:strand:+ start:617 stop:1483 length:867 start_codon:yes stop_codon:yes gene_type:complete